jgi:hypothetical protein
MCGGWQYDDLFLQKKTPFCFYNPHDLAVESRKWKNWRFKILWSLWHSQEGSAGQTGQIILVFSNPIGMVICSRQIWTITREILWSYPTICIVWRNVFVCLVMCRWQVRHGGQRRGSRQEQEIWCRGPGMVKHRSGTRWFDDREVRWRCVRSEKEFY